MEEDKALFELRNRFTDNSFVVVAKDQVYSDLAEEMVIMNLKTGKYYGLNFVGARVWNLIQNSIRVRDIRDTLLREYDVDSVQCESDLLLLLKDMEANGLIDIKDEKNN
jgi:hypothetical protein